jgi:homoserine dehydrogenase
MTIHPVRESSLYAALQLIGRLDFIRSKPQAIRVIEEEYV